MEEKKRNKRNRRLRRRTSRGRGERLRAVGRREKEVRLRGR